MTTVFVTHDQTEAIALADRIAVMEDGVLQQFATPQELKERPANLFVATFIGEPPMNIFDAGAQRERRPRCASGRAPTASSPSALDAGRRALARGRRRQPTRCMLGIRPHRIRVGGRPRHRRHGRLEPVARRPEPSRRSTSRGCFLVAVAARRRSTRQSASSVRLTSAAGGHAPLRRRHRRGPRARPGGAEAGGGMSARPDHRHRCRHLGHQGGGLRRSTGAQIAVAGAAEPLRRRCRAAASSRTWRAPGPTRRRCCASSPSACPTSPARARRSPSPARATAPG